MWVFSIFVCLFVAKVIVNGSFGFNSLNDSAVFIINNNDEPNDPKLAAPLHAVRRELYWLARPATLVEL